MKRTTKKSIRAIACLCLMVLLALSLTACSFFGGGNGGTKPNNSSNKEPNSTNGDKTPSIGNNTLSALLPFDDETIEAFFGFAYEELAKNSDGYMYLFMGLGSYYEDISGNILHLLTGGAPGIMLLNDALCVLVVNYDNTNEATEHYLTFKEDLTFKEEMEEYGLLLDECELTLNDTTLFLINKEISYEQIMKSEPPKDVFSKEQENWIRDVLDKEEKNIDKYLGCYIGSAFIEQDGEVEVVEFDVEFAPKVGNIFRSYSLLKTNNEDYELSYLENIAKIGTYYTEDSYFDYDAESECLYRYTCERPGFEYRELDNDTVIVDQFYYDTTMTSLEIPARTAGGKTVVGIDCISYYKVSDITGILIPDTIEWIDGWAFRELTNLNTIRYNGTLANWNEIMNHYRSDGLDLQKDCTLICTDGTKILPRTNYDYYD